MPKTPVSWPRLSESSRRRGASRAEVQEQKICGGEMKGEPRRRRASRYGAGLDGKTGGGWTVFGCL